MIIFILILSTMSPRGGTAHSEIRQFQQASDCLDLRDTLNAVRIAPGRYSCRLAVRK